MTDTLVWTQSFHLEDGKWLVTQISAAEARLSGRATFPSAEAATAACNAPNDDLIEVVPHG